MQPFTLQVVLNYTTSLNWCVNADADDATAEEEKHGCPLEHRHTGALTLHFGHTLVIAILASHLLGLFLRSFFLDFL